MSALLYGAIMATDYKTHIDPLTGKNRLNLTNGDMETVTGAEEAAQRIESALKTVLGEWPFDLLKGLPLFSSYTINFRFLTYHRSWTLSRR